MARQANPVSDMPLSDTVPDRQDKTDTQTSPDSAQGKIKPKIGYIQDRQDSATDKATGNTGDMQRYVNALFAGQKTDGSLCGRRKIGDQLGLSQQQCDKIHTSLKRKGLIKVEGLKTYPVYDFNETLNLIGESA